MNNSNHSNSSPNDIRSVAERRQTFLANHPRWVHETIDQAFGRQVERYPDRPCVISDDSARTYRQVAARAESYAKGLRQGGIGRGDRVALLVANYPEFIPLAYAIWRLGATLIPVNYAFRAKELGYVIEQSQCRALITMCEFRGLDFLDMLDELSPHWASDPASRFAQLRTVIQYDADGHRARPNVPTVEDILRAGLADHTDLPANTASPDDPAVIMYTSGTTGSPKGVLQSHDNLLRNSFSTAYHRAFEDGRRIVFALPLYHAFGLVMGVLASTWVGGAVVPQLKFDPVATFAAIQAHRVTDALFVPTMAMALVEHPDLGKYDLSSMFACLSGAAATPPWVWQRMAEGLGLRELVTGYGMTELSASTAMTDPEAPPAALSETVGAIINGGPAGIAELGGLVAEYRTCDPYSGELLPVGMEGELVCRSPLATSGYFALPELTAALFLEGGWLRSGDLGRVLANGHIQLTGRSKELYKSGGELVAPKEVEDVLAAHDGVAQAYVIGVPDERWGEIGAAWIIRSDGSKVGEQELISWCQERLAKFKWPRHVFFFTAADLPTTPTGKVQKFELVERARRALANG